MIKTSNKGQVPDLRLPVCLSNGSPAKVQMKSSPIDNLYDAVILGGGLSGYLTLSFLLKNRPHWRTVLIERRESLLQDGTWSFHHSDLSPETLKDIGHLLAHTWTEQEVIFPNLQRKISTKYSSFTKESLLSGAPHELMNHVKLGTEAVSIDPSSGEIILSNEQTIHGSMILDGRGQARPLGPMGYQKFYGEELEFSSPHGYKTPVLMDARVDQGSDFRFFYILPTSPLRALVEDTRFSTHPHFDLDGFEAGVKSYLKQRNLTPLRVHRTEKGVLPIALSKHPVDRGNDRLIPMGTRAGLLHPTTSYSLPFIFSFLEALSRLERPEPLTLRKLLSPTFNRFVKNQGFYVWLNKMLLLGSRPAEKRTLMEVFYRSTQSVIERFYSGNLNWTDKIRVLSLRPPVSLKEALKFSLTAQRADT